MTAPAGAIVRIYVVETQTGRRYRVLDVRVQQRGEHAERLARRPLRGRPRP